MDEACLLNAVPFMDDFQTISNSRISSMHTLMTILYNAVASTRGQIFGFWCTSFYVFSDG